MAEGPDDLEAAFDEVIGPLDPAMVVVTAADGEERDGCLVGFHAQLSIHPRRYVVFLSVKNRTFRVAEDASHLAVHALGAGDDHLAARFGGVSEDEPGIDKLEGLDWSPGPGGVPLVADLPARFVGRIVERLHVADGDHVGIVLEPVAADGSVAGTPLRLHHVRHIDAGHEA